MLFLAQHIDYAASRELLSGIGTEFSPDGFITRADFIAALGKLSEADVSGYGKSGFGDVADDNPAMPYIEWAAANNIAGDTGDGNFEPDSFITREDAALMIVNYAKVVGYELPVVRQAVTFDDEADISDYAKDAVKAIRRTGVISSKTDNLFDPQGNVTRGESATFLRRLLELTLDEETALGWVQNDSGERQYFDESGKAVTGWLNESGAKYWFDGNAIAVTGSWEEIGDKWYYFYENGRMAAKTIIDDYIIGTSGARMKKIKH